MPLEFSAQSKQQVDRLLSRYPTKQAALLPVLHVAQEEFGHLPDEAIELVSRTLDVSPAHIFGVITFYTMFHREKPGRNELMVCTNISCMLRGGYDILKHIETRLGIKAGETTRQRANDDLRRAVLLGPDPGQGGRGARRHAPPLAGDAAGEAGRRPDPHGHRPRGEAVTRGTS
jgi:NADH:ubiquinone oxidoreductase subunit E